MLYGALVLEKASERVEYEVVVLTELDFASNLFRNQSKCWFIISTLLL